MNSIFNVIKVTIISNYRNPKAMISMLLLPLVLIVVLSMAFTNSFGSSSINLKNARVLYTNGSSQPVSAELNIFINEGKKLGIEFLKASDINQGISNIKDSKYTCYIRVNDAKKIIQIYKNSNPAYSFNSGIIESMLKGIILRFDTISKITTLYPEKAGSILQNTGMSHTQAVSLGDKRKQTSTDYFSVIILLMIILYASFSGAFTILAEKTGKTIIRLTCSPIKRYQLFIGKVLGTIVITLSQILVLMLFCKFILGANWGTHVWILILIVVTEVIFAISMGIASALMFDNESGMFGLLNLIVPLVVFLGGGYMPLDNFNAFMLKVSNISPYKWTSQAVFETISGVTSSITITAIIINLAVASLLIAFSSIRFNKEGL